MSKYVAKGAMRSVKNQLKGYTEMQTKVRSATSNDPWGAPGALMAEIAQATHDPQLFVEIMAIIDKRLNDHGKNWRHVFKSLTLLDYLLHCGSEQVVRYAKENLYIVKTLREFQHIDDQGRDQGANVRQKAKLITALLNDDERLVQERKQRDHMHSRMSGYMPDDNDIGPSTGRNRPIERSRSAQGLRPEDDDDEIRRAIEESKRTAAMEQRSRRRSEDDLQQALLISEREEREKQEMIAAQNELILTDDVNDSSRNPWQQQGISSSAMELFGGSIEDHSLTAPGQGYQPGYESHYTYTNNTTTVGQNNPFGPSGHSVVQQQHHQQGPPLSLEAQSQLLALQAPGYGMDVYGNSMTGPGYASSEYGGSTAVSNMDSFGGNMASSVNTSLSNNANAMVPYGAGPSNALVTTNSNMGGVGGSNPFFSGNSNASVMGDDYSTYSGNSNMNGMGTMSTMNGMNTMSTMNGMNGMNTMSTYNNGGNMNTRGNSFNIQDFNRTGSNYGQTNYGGASTPMSGYNSGNTNSVGTLIDVGLPSGGQSFTPQQNKNPFQQQSGSGSAGNQGFNRSWM